MILVDAIDIELDWCIVGEIVDSCMSYRNSVIVIVVKRDLSKSIRLPRSVNLK